MCDLIYFPVFYLLGLDIDMHMHIEIKQQYISIF